MSCGCKSWPDCLHRDLGDEPYRNLDITGLADHPDAKATDGEATLTLGAPTGVFAEVGDDATAERVEMPSQRVEASLCDAATALRVIRALALEMPAGGGSDSYTRRCIALQVDDFFAQHPDAPPKPTRTEALRRRAHEMLDVWLDEAAENSWSALPHVTGITDCAWAIFQDALASDAERQGQERANDQ